MKILLILFSLLSISMTAQAQRLELNASDEGIAGDYQTLNTEAIQAAIDRCSSNQEGGRLTFTKGIYRTGSFELKSNVEIYLEKGAVILGSDNPYDYKNFDKVGMNKADAFAHVQHPSLALVLGNNLKHVAIRGKGTIDGNGEKLAVKIDSLQHISFKTDPYDHNRPTEFFRPQLFYLYNCKNVSISDLHLRNSSCWGLALNECENVLLERIHFINRAYWNNDGFDIADCRKVHVKDCYINSADDAFCLKSHNPDSCNEDILIENCTAISSASAVKFGTASRGGFKNITIRNMKVKNTFRSAIALECVDGGIMENILVENIHALNTGNAIFIRLGKRHCQEAGSANNITIRNLYAEIALSDPDFGYNIKCPAPASFHNPFPAPICGIPGHYIENVTLENIEIIYPGGASKGQAYIPASGWKKVPERENFYPEYSMFDELPAWGFYFRHVRNLKLNNIKLRTRRFDFRPAMEFEDIENIEQNGIVVRSAKPRLASEY